MDEMKQAGKIDNALREVAKQRDRLLSAVPTLSPGRRAALTNFLAGEFPVETALGEAVTKRDQLLNPSPPEIPASAEATLRWQLVAAEPARDGAWARGWRASNWRVGASIWRRILRSPPGAVLTACAVITAAILGFGSWGTPSRRNAAENFAHTPGVNLAAGVILDRSPIGRTELFARKTAIGPFNLNTSEPASLQASFVANNGIYFADGIETPLGLRLDLPMRAILMEDTLSRTP